MLDFSILPRFVLLLVRLICLAIAVLLALLTGVVLWARHGVAGFAFEQGDVATVLLMAFLFIFALGLAWAVGREMKRMPGR